MPKFISHSDQYLLTYDSMQSASSAENRSVTNFHDVIHADDITIWCPSGTANFQVWSNISAEYLRYEQESYHALINNTNFGENAKFNVKNPSFTANWFNITTEPIVRGSTSAFYIYTAAMRFIRLQGTGTPALTGGTAAYLWSSSCEPL